MSHNSLNTQVSRYNFENSGSKIEIVTSATSPWETLKIAIWFCWIAQKACNRVHMRMKLMRTDRFWITCNCKCGKPVEDSSEKNCFFFLERITIIIINGTYPTNIRVYFFAAQANWNSAECAPWWWYSFEIVELWRERQLLSFSCKKKQLKLSRRLRELIHCCFYFTHTKKK